MITFDLKKLICTFKTQYRLCNSGFGPPADLVPLNYILADLVPPPPPPLLYVDFISIFF